MEEGSFSGENISTGACLMRSFIAGSHWFFGTVAWVLVAVVAVRAAPAVTTEKASDPSATEKTRKSLETTVSGEFDSSALSSALKELGDQAKVKFVVDPAVNLQANMLAGGGGGATELQITAKLEKVKLRSAMKTLLSQHN